MIGIDCEQRFYAVIRHNKILQLGGFSILKSKIETTSSDENPQRFLHSYLGDLCTIHSFNALAD